MSLRQSLLPWVLCLIVIRFAFGLSSITNLNQEFPWGIWIGFDVVTGVAFAGGAYVLTFMVYILKSKKIPCYRQNYCT